jgi:hypothetical protein
MGDNKMRKFKKSLIILTAIIVILTVLAGATFAADNSSKLAAAYSNLRAHIYAGQYISFIKDYSFLAVLSSLLLFRVSLYKPQD